MSPITLLNADYKLLAKALANRITKYLPKLVNDDQTGYIKDRYIGTYIRLIEDMIHQTTKMKIPGIILTIDFEKAFDSLRWDFLYECLKLLTLERTSFISLLFHVIVMSGNIRPIIFIYSTQIWTLIIWHSSGFAIFLAKVHICDSPN